MKKYLVIRKIRLDHRGTQETINISSIEQEIIGKLGTQHPKEVTKVELNSLLSEVGIGDSILVFDVTIKEKKSVKRIN